MPRAGNTGKAMATRRTAPATATGATANPKMPTNANQNAGCRTTGTMNRCKEPTQLNKATMTASVMLLTIRFRKPLLFSEASFTERALQQYRSCLQSSNAAKSSTI